MSTGRIGVSPELAALEKKRAEIDAGIQGPDEAQATLLALAAGLFPDGLPHWEQLTWSEARGVAEANKDGARLSPEEKLREAEARYRTLVEQIPAVTFMAVLGEGRNEVYVSPHIEAMLGYSQKEWLEDPFLWYWRLHPEDRARWNEEFARGCATGGPFRAECRFMARDGHPVWVHGEARLVRDEHGRPMFLQGVAFDITESKRAQEVLLDQAVRKARAQEEVVIAQRVQTSLLPRMTSAEGLEIAAGMLPAEDVGGDYYDVLPFAGGAWIGIGDVSGHGIDAGLVMLMVQSATAAIVRTVPDATPREVIVQLNRLLFDNIRTRLRGDDFVTFTLFRYERDGRLMHAGAHEDMIVYRAATGRAETVRTPGTWLGAIPDVSRVTINCDIQLEEGDVVLLYTDGVTEAKNARGEMFELHRLVALVERVHADPVEVIRDAVFAAVRAWAPRQADDVTVVAMRYHARPAGTP